MKATQSDLNKLRALVEMPEEPKVTTRGAGSSKVHLAQIDRLVYQRKKGGGIIKEVGRRADGTFSSRVVKKVQKDAAKVEAFADTKKRLSKQFDYSIFK